MIEISDRLVRMNQQNQMNLRQTVAPKEGRITADCGVKLQKENPEAQHTAPVVRLSKPHFVIMPTFASKVQTEAFHLARCPIRRSCNLARHRSLQFAKVLRCARSLGSGLAESKRARQEISAGTHPNFSSVSPSIPRQSCGAAVSVARWP